MSLNGTWYIYDLVVDSYFELIHRRSRSTPGLPTVSVFTCNWYSMYWECSEQERKNFVRNMMDGRDIFTRDMVLFPILHAKHFRLIILDVARRELHYYDSDGSAHDRRRYLEGFHQFLTLAGRACGQPSWWYDLPPVTVHTAPVQRDAFSCGVFISRFAERYTRRATTSFDETKAPYYRMRMVYELAIEQLLSGFDV